jgi:FlaA1/EpsC-like NDP-sugar epimerase
MRLLARHRLWHVGADAVTLVAAWYLAFYFRFDDISPYWATLRDRGVFEWVAVKLVVLVGFGVYQRWWRYTSLRDLVNLARAAVVAELVAYAVLWTLPPVTIHRLAFAPAPRGVVALDLTLTLGLLVTIRAVSRLVFERARGGAFVNGQEVLVIGAGNAGEMVVRELVRSPGFEPIGILDDDPDKRHLRLHGVRVVGPVDLLDQFLAANRDVQVVIAMPAAAPERRRFVIETCGRLGVSVRTLPGPAELLAGDVVNQLRVVRVEDLLGRAPVKRDLQTIGGYLTGRCVLVTGAGGSIGSELVRQITRLGPDRLVLVDNGENNLFGIDHELRSRGVEPVTVIADVRDTDRMRSVLGEHQPSVLFHAAAYKHVPMMELNPVEAIRNNTLATRDLAMLAGDCRVERFVLVSTDKAVNPQTVMGASKALCEWVVEAAAQGESETRFIAVRFGNVLGSAGSVIPIFRQQITTGGPVRVTDQRMTRYFMTIPEAAQLVVEAGGIGEGGDIFVLDMGEPVRIVDLAHQMIRLAGKEPGRDIQIEFTGIRPGEKLQEDLFEPDEAVEPTRHQKLRVARRAPIDAEWLTGKLATLELLAASGEQRTLVAAVLQTVRHPVRAMNQRDRVST